MRTSIFSARFVNLDSIRDFVGQAAVDAGLDERQVYAVQLSTDEACTNVIEHAYGGECDDPIEVTCNVHYGGLTVIIRDHGRVFDPGSVPEPDLKAGLAERGIGGLGVYLIRKMMDKIEFESSPQNGNVLTMVKYRQGN
ncbi:MAG: ATP-binding protein [Anaerolineales bacterium]|nr:ATP-binding protein [Anaerolineales bacterium]